MRVLSHLVSALGGAVVGVAAVAVYREGWWGLLLAVAASFALAWALLQVGSPRRLYTSYAAGWLVPFVAALVGRAEGDYAVTSDLAGYVLMAVAVGMVFVGIGAFAGPRPRRADD